MKVSQTTKVLPMSMSNPRRIGYQIKNNHEGDTFERTTSPSFGNRNIQEIARQTLNSKEGVAALSSFTALVFAQMMSLANGKPAEANSEVEESNNEKTDSKEMNFFEKMYSRMFGEKEQSEDAQQEIEVLQKKNEDLTARISLLEEENNRYRERFIIEGLASLNTTQNDSTVESNVSTSNKQLVSVEFPRKRGRWTELQTDYKSTIDSIKVPQDESQQLTNITTQILQKEPSSFDGKTVDNKEIMNNLNEELKQAGDDTEKLREL